ncbi:hypothetical protein ACOSQ3_021871 [Xanthoceras sorbifolium]
MKQPEGFENAACHTHVCYLHKSLYGLKQAQRAWFDKLKCALLGWGFKSSVSNHSLFIRKQAAGVILLLVYVDDILVTGSDIKQVHQVIAAFNAKFALKTLSSLKYFLGFEAPRDQHGLHLSQSKYARDLLQKTNMAAAKPYPTPASGSLKLTISDGAPFFDPSLYRSTIGALQYLTLTRPDIAFVVNKLSQFLKAPTQFHWLACKRVLRYIIGTLNFGIQFTPAKHLVLEGFVNVD